MKARLIHYYSSDQLIEEIYFQKDESKARSSNPPKEGRLYLLIDDLINNGSLTPAQLSSLSVTFFERGGKSETYVLLDELNRLDQAKPQKRKSVTSSPRLTHKPKVITPQYAADKLGISKEQVVLLVTQAKAAGLDIGSIVEFEGKKIPSVNLKGLKSYYNELVKAEKEVASVQKDGKWRYNVPEPSIGDYVSEIRSFDPLTKDEESVMVRRYHKYNDMQALECLIKANLRFVVYIARRYSNHNQYAILGDLIQTGNMAILRAAKLFRPELGFKFISYAVWWIRKYFQLEILNANPVRLPQRIFSVIKKVQNAENQLMMTLKREPTLEEIAQETKKSVKLVKKVKELPTIISIDSWLDDTKTLKGPDAFHEVDSKRQLLDGAIKQALLTLKDKEAEALIHYFGLLGGNKLSYQATGNIMNLSREGARRVVERALNKLRESNLSVLKEFFLEMIDE